MPLKPPTRPPKRHFFLWYTGILGILLCLLFYRSFSSGHILFSNDGPLGSDHAAAYAYPGVFWGMWHDLNGLGHYVGIVTIEPTSLLHWLLGPLDFAKFYVPIALFVLGSGAGFCFRRFGFSPLAATLGGLAAALNSAFFSDACWGVGTHEIAFGMDFCALGLIVSSPKEKSRVIRWLQLAVAGMAVGINVTEAADIGAIFSLLVAAFIFSNAFSEENIPAAKKIGNGIGRVTLVALFAGFLAAQSVITLIGSQVVGIAGVGEQQTETPQQHWDWATQWSLPKKETLGLIIPGLFGYRMDTPRDMAPWLQPYYEGGNYWGGMGRTPAIDRYFDSGRQGQQPPGIMRFSGGGGYAGILVATIAFWAVAQSFRRKNSVFTSAQKKFIWFWLAVFISSLLISWGRFAPIFYGLFYQLPYADAIRNPAKFFLVLSCALVIIFAYGVDGLSRRYLDTSATGTNSISKQLANWWSKVHGFDRKWTISCLIALAVSVLGWLTYASEKSSLVAYLESVGFPNEGGTQGLAQQIAAFSIGQVGWFILIFALTVGLVILVTAGIFSGKRARLGGILLGALLVLDLGRADLPWIIHWNYKQKYEIGTLNPIVKFLAEKPYEHRVAILPFPFPEQFELFDQLYRIEWAQHLFLYYNIQSLDIVQRPRTPADVDAFEHAMTPSTDSQIWLIARRWQLTNTRFLLGPAGYVDVMNDKLDPGQHRFRIVRRFSIVPKPDVPIPNNISPEQYAYYLPPDKQTAQISPDGEYALFEFTGALPRAKLYTDWQTNSAADLKDFTTNGLSAEDLYIFGEAGTNDFLTLKKLASSSFNPEQIVLLEKPLPTNPDNTTNQNSGTVKFKSYAPKDIVFNADAIAPSVLLLNDKFDPHWIVRVDGKIEPLLRCNFIMRGVYLTPGKHTVEFKFILSHKLLYANLVAVSIGVVLLTALIFLERKQRNNP